MFTACRETSVRITVPRVVLRYLLRFLVCVAALSVCMILIGLLLTRIAAHTWPISVEDGVDRFLAAHRTGWVNATTDVLSGVANTFGAGALALVAVCWARWRCGRWAEALFIAFCVLLELAVFLLTTLAVHRPRPAVLELDVSPPTSSFPSGHTAAAVALYGAVALLVYRRTGRRSSWLLLLMPAAVGFARLYRGMHHPSDVAAGVLLGGLSIWAAQRCVLRGLEPPRTGSRPATAAQTPRTQRTPPAPAVPTVPDVLIVNGAKADGATVQKIEQLYGALCARTGRPAPRVVTTSPQDHGAGAAAAAVRAGARLVVACGGDGTVNEVAGPLVGTETALGIVPLGTGNLLAANLGIPDTMEEALSVLVDGTERRIDVGRLDDGIFLGMAGMGLDAAMVGDAPESLKHRAGWAAYAVAAIRHLPDRVSSVTVDVDGRRSRHRDVSMVLIGNIGRLQAGLAPMPGAAVDSGVLDLAVVSPRGAFAWLRVGAALRAGEEGDAGHMIYRDSGRRITISTRRPVPCEADGETLPGTTRMTVEVQRGALRVRVAPSDPDAAAPAPDASVKKERVPR